MNIEASPPSPQAHRGGEAALLSLSRFRQGDQREPIEGWQVAWRREENV
jgi:hypothetical protein